jgi:hypothetical protein
VLHAHRNLAGAQTRKADTNKRGTTSRARPAIPPSRSPHARPCSIASCRNRRDAGREQGQAQTAASPLAHQQKSVPIRARATRTWCGRASEPSSPSSVRIGLQVFLAITAPYLLAGRSFAQKNATFTDPFARRGTVKAITQCGRIMIRHLVLSRGEARWSTSQGELVSQFICRLVHKAQ